MPKPAPVLLAAASLLAIAGAVSAASAQPGLGPSDTVSWSVAPPADPVKPGGKVKLTLKGAVQDGWHVYGLQQPPDGPTPLKVGLDSSEVATADGPPTGAAPTKLYDPSFNLETQFYTHDFTVTAPVRLSGHLASGKQTIALNVRFQTCNGHICQPPKTVRLSVPVTVRAG